MNLTTLSYLELGCSGLVLVGWFFFFFFLRILFPLYLSSVNVRFLPIPRFVVVVVCFVHMVLMSSNFFEESHSRRSVSFHSELLTLKRSFDDLGPSCFTRFLQGGVLLSKNPARL